jgi:hypothetical protein
MLFRDACGAIRTLKREHRSVFDSDPAEFRRQLGKAEGRVLNRKPGPKPDADIASAAREVVAGTQIEGIFQLRFPGLKTSNEALYAMALESFRTKVNAYIRRRPRLKNLRDGRKRHNNAEKSESTV